MHQSIPAVPMPPPPPYPRANHRALVTCIFLFLILSYLVKVDAYLLYKTPNKQTCLSVCLS